jgi:transposase-like protein
MEKAMVTCPHCGQETEKEIPVGKCEAMYDCPHCGKRVVVKEGMCCVICSYSDAMCHVSVKKGAKNENS